MKNLKTILSILAMWCFTTLPAQETGKGIQFHENENWESILQLAQKENKMIFMDCYTSWCGPCRALSQEIFPQEKVGDFFNPRFINVKYDMEKGDGKMLYAKYKKNIIGFPTLLLLDKDGNVLQQMAGFQKADELIEGIRKASEGRDLFTLRKEYQEGKRDLPFMKEYLESLNAAFLKDTIAQVTRECIEAMEPQELDKDEVWNLYGAYVTDVRSKAFEYLVKNIYRYHHKLHRDRYTMEHQLSNACEKELRNLLDIEFDKEQTPLPLSTDTLFMQQIINYMDKAGLPQINRSRAKLFIHKLLLTKQYDRAWDIIMLCKEMNLNGFYSPAIHTYINYLMSVTSDKKQLKAFLQILEGYRNQTAGNDFNYHMYRTMSILQSKLGNKKAAEELTKIYEREDEAKRKEIEEFLKKN